MEAPGLITNPYFYAAVISVGITAVIWVQFTRRAMPSPAINWLKAIMTCGVILNTYMVWLFFITDRTRLIWLNNLYIIFIGILMVSTIYFAINYIGKSLWLRSLWPHFVIIAPTIAIVILVVAQPGLVLGGDYSTTRWAPWGIEDTKTPPLYGLYVAWLLAYVTAHNALLIWAYKHNSSRIYRKQSMLIIIADNIPMLAAMLTLGILPALNIHILPLNTYANSITFGLLGYALLRYGSVVFDPYLITNSIVNTMGSAALVLGPDNRIVYANQAACSLFGVSNSRQLLDKLAEQFLSRETLDSLAQSSRDGEKDIGPIESYVLLQKGARRAVNIYNSYFLDHNNRTLGMVLVFADIQNLKDSLNKASQLSQQLREQKAGVERTVMVRTQELADEKSRFIASVNSLRFGFILTDQSDQIIYTNDALWGIFDLHNHSLSQLQDELNTATKLAEHIKKCRLDKRPIDIADIQHDGKTLRVLIAPVSNESNPDHTIGTVVLIEDITDAKSFERSRDEFFSIASHELRTPLTTIRGNTSMLLQYYGDNSKPDERQLIEDIHDSSVRLIQIVNDFLDMSRIEQGRISYNVTAFSMADVVNYVVNDIAKSLPNRDVTLTIDPSVTNLPLLRGDSDRCKQVIYNLVGNAVKFTPRGSVTVSAISTKRRAKIMVSDTGTGIPLDRQGLLFRKFQQASADIYTRDTTRSTGLGLYVSRLITKQMHGSLRLEHSEVGKGTSFSITLPLAESSTSGTAN